MLILKVQTAFIFLGETEINNLIVVSVNYSSIEWIGFVFNYMVESLDAFVNILLFIVCNQVA